MHGNASAPSPDISLLSSADSDASAEIEWKEAPELSLTWHLKQQGSPVREFFVERFPNTRPFATDLRTALKDAETLLPPDSSRRYPFGIVGQAIDFRIRMYFSPDQFSDMVSRGLVLAAGPFARQWVRSQGIHLIRMAKRASSAKGTLNREQEESVCRICVALSWFEAMGRGAPAPQELRSVNWSSLTAEQLTSLPEQIWIDDLVQMSWRFAERRSDWFNQQAICNPLFDGGDDVQGADGDLILGHTLLDFKTTIRFAWDRNSLYQIIAYALLDYDDRYALDSIGFYLPRQDVLRTWPLEHLLRTAGNDLSLTIRSLRQALRDIAPATGQWVEMFLDPLLQATSDE